MAAENGHLAKISLTSIGRGFYLAHEPAKYFLAMVEEAKWLYGHDLRVRDAYRSYERQVYFWRLYINGHGKLAAKPGYSNHGWGLAIDLFDEDSRAILDRIGSKYGWSKAHSDAPGEWWHIKWDPALVNRSAIDKAQQKIHRAKLAREYKTRRHQLYHEHLAPAARRWVARRLRSLTKALGKD